MADQFYNDIDRFSYAYAGNFDSLIPFGILTLSSFHGLPGPAPVAPDGWNWAPPLPWTTYRRGTFESELEFLSSNDFIRATYRMQGNGIAKVRIYVLSEDCEWYRQRQPRIEFRGRALLKKLWDIVDANPRAWRSAKERNTTPLRLSLSAADDVSLNLSAVFNTLPSPQPDPEITDSAPPTTRYLLELVLDDDGVPGFKSQLYQYQRESVWKMLQRELLPQRRLDPRLRKWTGPTGLTSWINTEDMTFYRKQQYVNDIRGGILCEEMGTGKTCVCLALILLTVHQRAQPPSGCTISQPKPTTLYQQCFNIVINQGIPFKHLDPRPHFYNDLENATPYYLLKPPPPKRASRRKVALPPELIYLSTSTLVVVPDTLIQQWSTEILKHVQDDVLNYLVISKSSQPIPAAKDLLKVDLLLLSHSRFAKEDDDGRFEDYRQKIDCPHVHTPDDIPYTCRCSESMQTPLMQIRWKRLIIDEGHVLGIGTTRLVSLAGRLRVERKWCVTGTISNHMMGMDFGMERTLSGQLIDDTVETGLLTPPEEAILASRKPEQLDLKRLGAIMIDFLHTPPFYTAEIWNRFVVRPYAENIPGSMSSLRSIMTLMIRHRAKDIELDVRLPKLHIKTVLLTPTRENRLSTNVIAALIALNAVLTQRCEQDYFFHSSQVKARDEVVRNLILAAFHFTGPKIESVVEAIGFAERGLEKAQERGYSAEDVDLLRRAVGHLMEAVQDLGWRTMVVRELLGKEDLTAQEMGFMLEGCPEKVGDAWGLTPVIADPKDTDRRVLFSGPALMAMQSHLPALAGTPAEDHVTYLTKMGIAKRVAEEKELEEARQEMLERLKKKDGTPKKSIPRLPQSDPFTDEQQKLRKVVQHEIDHYDLSKPESPQKRQRPVTQSDPQDLKSILKQRDVPPDIPDHSPLKQVRIHRSASAKLNYLLSRILELYRTEKIIIFSDYGPMMWYIGESLELLGIEHLIYIQRLMPQRRAQYIVTFNSSPHFRVLIMETRVAAHGLNVTAASRVFFVNMCWQKSVERQAIKRAHRIGQTREVFVETLVLKGTIEEELLKRREEMGREQLDKTKRFTDDSKLRGIISSTKFVPDSHEESQYVGFGPLFKPRETTNGDIERELEVADDEKVMKKNVLAKNVENSDTERDVDGNTRKRSINVILKVPTDAQDGPENRKRRKVQFADM